MIIIIDIMLTSLLVLLILKYTMILPKNNAILLEFTIKKITFLMATILLALTAIIAPSKADEIINLYTDRQAVFFDPIIRAFEEQTDIKVQALYLKKGLLERMKAESSQSAADIIYAVDAGRLQDFVAAGLVQPYPNSINTKALPQDLYTNDWIGITRRARVLYVSKKTPSIRRYEDLATASDARVCIRSGKHHYNIALIADMVSRIGEQKTEQWLRGIKKNLARSPGGNDRAQIKGVINGECTVGLANHYYFYKVAKTDEQRQKINEKLDVIFPEQLHININGAALAANAPNKENALRFMQFLISKKAQQLFAKHNNEYPARNDITVPAHLQLFTKAIDKAAPLADIARYRSIASQLVEKVELDG